MNKYLNMSNKNYVFAARSLDGYIAKNDGDIDWLSTTVPNPGQKDLGYLPFMAKIDAIIMGRHTFEKVLSFNIPWPYSKPVLVATKTIKEISIELKDKVDIVKGNPGEIVKQANDMGYNKGQ